MHSATFLLHSNLFRCYGKHIGLAWPHCNDTSVTLLQNTFKRSSNTAVELYLPNVPLIHVKGNTFSDLKGAALSLRLSDAVDSDSHSVVISDNLFTAVGRPHIDSVVSVNCFWGRQSASLVHVLNISLSRNDFYFNLASATVVTTCASLFLTENTFVNPGAVHDYGVGFRMRTSRLCSRLSTTGTQSHSTTSLVVYTTTRTTRMSPTCKSHPGILIKIARRLRSAETYFSKDLLKLVVGWKRILLCQIWNNHTE